MDIQSAIQFFLAGFCLYAGIYAFCVGVNAISRAFTGMVDV